MKIYNDDNRLKISFKLNDELLQKQVKPRQLLSDFLRFDCGMTGTHVGCEHGICGSCTVKIDGLTARSCLKFAVQLDGKKVETVESFKEKPETRNILEKFKAHHSLQCGFCTPGMVMSAIDLLNHKKNPSDKEIRDWLEGNICRCTGYQNIVAAVKEAASKM